MHPTVPFLLHLLHLFGINLEPPYMTHLPLFLFTRVMEMLHIECVRNYHGFVFVMGQWVGEWMDGWMDGGREEPK